MLVTALKYAAAMGAISLGAPLFWIIAMTRYSNFLQEVFRNNDYLVHLAVYPMLASWISVFSLSLGAIVLFNIIKWNFLWTVLPVTLGTIVLIFVLAFFATWGSTWDSYDLRSFPMWVSTMMFFLAVPSVIVWVNYLMVQISRGRKKYT